MKRRSFFAALAGLVGAACAPRLAKPQVDKPKIDTLPFDHRQGYGVHLPARGSGFVLAITWAMAACDLDAGDCLVFTDDGRATLATADPIIGRSLATCRKGGQIPIELLG